MITLKKIISASGINGTFNGCIEVNLFEDRNAGQITVTYPGRGGNLIELPNLDNIHEEINREKYLLAKAVNDMATNLNPVAVVAAELLKTGFIEI